MCCFAVRSILLYGCEMWSLSAGNVHRSKVYDHRCLGSIAMICWSECPNNVQVKNLVWDAGSGSNLQNLIDCLGWIKYCVW